MKIQSTGKQIQNISSLLCVLGWFVCAIIGIVSFATGYLFMGIIVILGGGYIVWTSTRLLQGFGELVEDTTANRANTDRILFILESLYKSTRSEPADTYTSSSQRKPADSNTSSNWICKKCGTENTFDSQFCKECRQQAWVKK